jgi:hypothetical protein
MLAIPSLGDPDRYDIDMESADGLFATLAQECGLGPPGHIRRQYFGDDALDDYDWNNMHTLPAKS